MISVSFNSVRQWKVMHELDYELTLVETIRDCVEDLEMETCSQMTPEVIVPNKGNNEITELRTILQRESQNS